MRAAAPAWRIGFMKCRVEREPSVSWLPYFSSLPVACATLTRDQSASSSSATISGMPVRTPCPISERWQTIVTSPSGAIATNTAGSLIVPCGMPSAPHLGASAARAGRARTASTRPPAASIPVSTPRRLTFSMTERAGLRRLWFMSRSRCLLDGGPNALVCAAAAEIAVHGRVDVVVGRMRVLLEQRRSLHDLAGLAVSALRDVVVAPRYLERVIALRVEPFDGGDRLAARVAHRRLAGAHRVAVEVDRARAAGCDAAAEFRPGQS